MRPDHQEDMETATCIIIWSIVLAGVAAFAIWALPDPAWIADKFQEYVVQFGGYGNAH